MNQNQEEREDWMYRDFRLDEVDGYNPEFLRGLITFLKFAIRQPSFMNGKDIKCPCNLCRNAHFKEPDLVHLHLLSNGFVKNYHCWLHHGETLVSKTKETTLVSDHESNACCNNSDSDEVQEKPRRAKKRKAEKKGLTNKWDDDEVEKKLRKAKKNRLTEPEKPGTSLAKRTEGLKCARQHKKASAKEKKKRVLNSGCGSQSCSSIASASTVDSGASSEFESKSIKRVKARPSKAKWQSKAQLNCLGLGSLYTSATLEHPSKPLSYEEMQSLLEAVRAQQEEVQRRFLEQEEWLVDKEERLQEKEEELRDKELQLMEREKNAIRWAKKWDLLFPVSLPPNTSTDGKMIREP